jgi:hypothetical protein
MRREQVLADKNSQGVAIEQERQFLFLGNRRAEASDEASKKGLHLFAAGE